MGTGQNGSMNRSVREFSVPVTRNFRKDEQHVLNRRIFGRSGPGSAERPVGGSGSGAYSFYCRNYPGQGSLGRRVRHFDGRVDHGFPLWRRGPYSGSPVGGPRGFAERVGYPRRCDVRLFHLLRNRHIGIIERFRLCGGDSGLRVLFLPGSLFFPGFLLVIGQTDSKKIPLPVLSVWFLCGKCVLFYGRFRNPGFCISFLVFVCPALLGLCGVGMASARRMDGRGIRRSPTSSVRDNSRRKG